MMASVDEGMGDVFEALEETGQLDNTFILFLGDNGYFFGEHGLGPERRFAYEEGIRSPFLVRYPAWFKPGTVNDDLVLALDIAPTLLDLAGAKAADSSTSRALSLRPLSTRTASAKRGWRTSFMCEYFGENAMPWLVGMSYKAIRTTRAQVHPLDAEVARRRGMRRALRPQGRSLRDEESDRQARRGAAGRAAAQAARSTRFAVRWGSDEKTHASRRLARPAASRRRPSPGAAMARQADPPDRAARRRAPPPTSSAALYAEELGKSLGQTVVVDNKTGAGGTIAMAERRARRADGYTLGVIAQGLLVYNLGLYKTPGYDPLKDLIVLSVNVSVANVLIVHPSNPAKTVADVLEQARAKQGEFTFSSGGVGTSHHMSGVLLEMRSGVKLTHVPYRATPAGIQAVVNGEVAMGLFNTPTVVGLIRAGKLKAIAVTSEQRSSCCPSCRP